MTAQTNEQAGKSTMTLQGDREIRVERIFNAPRDKVWRAYTERDLVAQWWGRGNPLDVEKFDVKPGGSWRFVEKFNGQSMGFEGRFIEVTPPERLVQTFGWDGMKEGEMIDTAEFHDLGEGRTRLVVTSVYATPEDRTAMLNYGMEGGMNESYAALDRLLEKL
jgi:uncharacterized protein YndB with AHSA1/START domain